MINLISTICTVLFLTMSMIAVYKDSAKKTIYIYLILTSVALTSTLLTFDMVKKAEPQPIEPSEIVKQLTKEMPERYYEPKTLKDPESINQEFTKKSAVDSLTNIFMLFNEKKDEYKDLTNKDAFDKIVNEEVEFKDIVLDEALSKVHLDDVLKTDDTYINVALIMYSLMGQLGEMKPNIIDFNMIYLDSKSSMAYIPLDVYTGSPNLLYIPLIYVDNEWKISPYSLIREIHLSDVLTRKEN